jgi:hypothetical protein
VGTIAPDSAGLCDAFARIAAADRTSAQAAEGLTAWSDLQTVIVASSEEAVVLYDEALALAPDEVFEDLLLVRDVTDEAGGLAAASDSAEEFQAVGQEIEDFAAAEDAVARLNQFSRQECGFPIADN